MQGPATRRRAAAGSPRASSDTSAEAIFAVSDDAWTIIFLFCNRTVAELASVARLGLVCRYFSELRCWRFRLDEDNALEFAPGVCMYPYLSKGGGSGGWAVCAYDLRSDRIRTLAAQDSSLVRTLDKMHIPFSGCPQLKRLAHRISYDDYNECIFWTVPGSNNVWFCVDWLWHKLDDAVYLTNIWNLVQESTVQSVQSSLPDRKKLAEFQSLLDKSAQRARYLDNTVPSRSRLQRH